MFIKKWIKISCFMMFVFSGVGCSTYTTNTSIVPYGENWVNDSPKAKTSAKVDYYRDYSNFGYGAEYKCEDFTIVASPIPYEYGGFGSMGVFGAPIIPVPSKPQRPPKGYWLEDVVEDWSKSLHLLLEIERNDKSKNYSFPHVSIELNNTILLPVEKLDIKTERDFKLFLLYFDMSLENADVYKVIFNKYLGCKIPDLVYKKETFHNYNAVEKLGPP